MRIISGKFKGKKIIQPLDKNTRPLKDLTKESIFNLILHSKFFSFNFEKLNILDLFAGSGSFGLECLSRNCQHLTFVENYKPALDILKKNIYSLDIKDNFEIIQKNIFNKKTFNNINRQFDLIFLDPPYKEKKINEILNIILDSKIIKNKGLIIIHRDKKSIDKFSDKFITVDSRVYGVSKIIFLLLK